MNTADLIYREMDQRYMPKNALTVLQKCDRLINFHNANEPVIRTLHLFKDDFDKLAYALELRKQDITKHTYRGYRLECI